MFTDCSYKGNDIMALKNIANKYRFYGLLVKFKAIEMTMQP